MSWMRMLEETYAAACRQADDPSKCPVPPAHVMQQAHVEVVLDGEGNFRSAKVLEKEPTLIPATEASAGRTSGASPHPLCDKIQYVAGDYEKFGGVSKSYFNDFKSGGKTEEGYLSLLSAWNNFRPHPYLRAVLNYVSKRTLVSDLVESKVLFVGADGKLLTKWEGRDAPQIFKVLTKKAGITDQGSALVRWVVQIDGAAGGEVWECDELKKSWLDFYVSRMDAKSICYVTGEDKPYAVNHPARLRYSGDKAKLISSNDKSGFTFRGRFRSSEEACTVGFDVTQKAHSTLRWLIERQGFKNDSQVIVSWAVNMAKIPSVSDSSYDLFEEMTGGEDPDSEESGAAGDVGTRYAIKLTRKLKGYTEKLKDRDDIVIMAMDSATPGRMAITYYQEIKGSDFLKRVENYHRNYAWRQRFGKDKKFIGAPSIIDIARSAYAVKADDSLIKATITRLLPVISEGMPFPRDLLLSICRRAIQPQSVEPWEFEKILGIACGLYRGCYIERGYKMSLEKDRRTRDYLFGRLLAIADRIENRALYISGESRSTSAMKYMTRFAARPAETWEQILVNSLPPYRDRLQAKDPASLSYYDKLITEITAVLFKPEDFTSNEPLSPEFLLGFYCQRYELWNRQNDNPENQAE